MIAKYVIIAAIILGGAVGGYVIYDMNTHVDIGVDTENGSVDGIGSYKKGDTATLSASPDHGYYFAGWYDGDTLLSEETSYSFTVDSAKTLKAQFERRSFMVTVSDSPYGDESGTGTFLFEDSVTITAEADYGYIFESWVSDGTVVSDDETYTFPLNDNITLSASYERAPFTISATTAPSGIGSVEGTGVYLYTDTATVSAQEQYGYEFVNWTVDDVVVSSDPTYSFSVEKDGTVCANYTRKQFTVTLVGETPSTSFSVYSTKYYYEDVVKLEVPGRTGYEIFAVYLGNGVYPDYDNITFTVIGDVTYQVKYFPIHDAQFSVTTSDPRVDDNIQCMPKYYVEVSSEVWTFKDADTDAPVAATNMLTDASGIFSFEVATACDLEITRTVTYSDGETATYTVEITVESGIKATYSWSYTHGGVISNASITITFSSGIYNDYVNSLTAEDGRRRTTNPQEMVTYNDALIKELASHFTAATSGFTDVERVQYVLNFVVNSIDYVLDEDSKGIVEYWNYPYETLYNGIGDCEDTALLFASIIKAMGYEVALINPPGHLLAGTSIDGASGTYYSYGGIRYFCCETAADGWYPDVGHLSSSYKGVSANIYVVS